MTPIKEKRRIIQNYVDNLNNVSPLQFVPYIKGRERKVVGIPEMKCIEDTILEILKMSQSYCSSTVDENEIETTPGRLRSAIDIWRHAKTVIPDISIFTVMEIIYSIRKELYGHYCCTVHRTVFKPAYGYHGYVADEEKLYCTEFNDILFTEWNKLHYSRKPRKVVKRASKNK